MVVSGETGNVNMIHYYSGCMGGGEKVEKALSENVLRVCQVMLSYALINERSQLKRFRKIYKQRRKEK